MKIVKPLPHAIIDYAWAGAMMAAPWLFGFRKNRAAMIHAVSSGAAILGLSLMTRYPLGAVKWISFPVHGVIEASAGLNTALAPWLLGFSDDRGAKLTHLIGGLSTLGVAAMTDYRAAEKPYERMERFREQLPESDRESREYQDVDLGPPARLPAAARTGGRIGEAQPI